MSKEIYNMLVEVLTDMQSVGSFKRTPADNLNFKLLKKDDVEWYLKEYIVENVNIQGYLNRHDLEEEFQEYLEKVSIS